MTARSWFRKWHKWPSIFLSLFILLFCVSGIILNHRNLFSSVDVNRFWLPSDYHYKNWNLAAVKSSLKVGNDSILIYGNLGVWLSDSAFTRFRDFNKGFPQGIDNRKIFSMLKTSDGDWYAGTLMGLYCFSKQGGAWKKINLPVSEERINRILEVDGALYVQTRSHFLRGTCSKSVISFGEVVVPPAENEDGRVGLFRTLWVIHSGEIYGTTGKLFIDFIGLVFIFLTLTGLVHWLVPGILKRIGSEIRRHRVKMLNRWSLRWHNITGSWLIVILLMTTITGMFLRPPLLIAIASSKVSKIPYSLLDNKNPWFDKFRDVIYDTRTERFLFSTPDGIYYSDKQLNSKLKTFLVQPPVSVMGITYFDTIGPGAYLVGSFSGLFRWDPGSGTVQDYLTGQPWMPKSGRDAVIGTVAVTGCIPVGSDQMLIFDFAKGAITAVQNQKTMNESHPVKFPDMPAEVQEASPMSLWNVALEFHTCRIWNALIGEFYILLIPLLGLGILFVLVTGFFSWYLGRKVKKKIPA